jgi:hypothetical protein
MYNRLVLFFSALLQLFAHNTTHKKNAKFMSHWIRHHAHMFDMVVMLDLGSTDSSLLIARAEAPTSWLIKSAHDFDGTTFDKALLMADLYAPPESWRITLNPTEFVIQTNIRKSLAEFKVSGVSISPDGTFLSRSVGLPLLHMNCDVNFLEPYKSPLSACSSYYVGSIQSNDAGLFCMGNCKEKIAPDAFTSGFIASFSGTPKNTSLVYQVHTLEDIFLPSEGQNTITSAIQSSHVIWHEFFA